MDALPPQLAMQMAMTRQNVAVSVIKQNADAQRQMANIRAAAALLIRPLKTLHSLLSIIVTPAKAGVQSKYARGSAALFMDPRRSCLP
jgi:hypothetical protein